MGAGNRRRPTKQRGRTMINRHRLKALGLALAAVLAMSIGGASLASAAELHSESAPVVITGTQHNGLNSIDVQWGHLTCATVQFNATTTVTTDTTVTLTPHFTGCVLAGVATVVDTNGCHFLLHVTGADVGTMTVDCPVGQEIVITNGNKCTIHVPTNDIGSATLTNVGVGTTREITAHFGGLTSIAYTQTPGTGVAKCPALTTINGKYTGAVTFTAETHPGGVHTGLFVT